MRRRAWLLGAMLPMCLSHRALGNEIRPRTLMFPSDFGAHPNARTEWWYATGAV